jgi:hypothetical protein
MSDSMTNRIDGKERPLMRGGISALRQAIGVKNPLELAILDKQRGFSISVGLFQRPARKGLGEFMRPGNPPHKGALVIGRCSS